MIAHKNRLQHQDSDIMPKVDMLSNEALIEEISRRFNLEF